MFLYRLITSFLYTLFLPLLRIVFSGHDFKQRTSFRNVYCDDSIWIHAASVGEVRAVKPLIRKLVENYRTKTFIMTCVTKTGLAAAKEVSDKLIVHQFPLDIAHLMNRAFNVFKPSLVIIVETEIWPNMLNQAYHHNVPVIMINARMSQRSYKRYRWLRWFMRKEFSMIKLICAQSERDMTKFKQLKFKNVVNANNLKFAIELPEHESHVLRRAWNYKPNDFVIAFGCSRPGEEILIKRVYERLIPVIPRLKLVIAPRHLLRLPEVLQMFSRNEYSLFSESNTSKPILIVDEMGVLPQIYALSDIVIIGGSFYNFGGHNPLEAIWYEKAVIIGGYHQSCIETVEKLLSEKAIIVSNSEKLFHDIYTLYQNVEHRIQIGRKAKSILLDNQFALKNHWDAIVKWIN